MACGIKDLARGIAERAVICIKDAEEFIGAFKEEVIAQCKAGEEVKLVGFCSFQRKTTKARKGRNPHTGEDIQIPAKDKFVAKAAKGVDVSAPKATSGRRR